MTTWDQISQSLEKGTKQGAAQTADTFDDGDSAISTVCSTMSKPNP